MCTFDVSAYVDVMVDLVRVAMSLVESFDQTVMDVVNTIFIISVSNS